MATKIPAFSTTCRYATELSDGYWYIYLYTSGDFRLSYAKKGVDVFLCGGGGAGATHGGQGGNGGGGGGYVDTRTNQSLNAGQTYPIVIGEGGQYMGGENNWYGNPGGSTSAFGFSAAGGTGGDMFGNPGIGYASGGRGGGDPTAGGDGVQAFGRGSVFYGAGGGGGADDSCARYSPGGKTGGGTGGRNRAAGTDGVANTGGGGGAAGGGEYDSSAPYAGKGGSGIVILRGTEDDFTPVYFNGTQLSEIYFNGEKLLGLIYGGTRVY